jgi:tetratricopeptide (TPR) repeat protein
VFSTYYAIEAATRAREATAATLAATKSRDTALAAKEAADEREREATRLNTRLMAMKVFAKYGIIEAFYRKDLPGFDRRLIKVWLDNAVEVAKADQFRTGTIGEADLLTFVGTLYKQFGFNEEARPLLQSALEIRKRALGSDHIETVWQRALLAQVLDLTGDKAGAQELALAVAERFSDLLSSDQDEAIETAVFGVMRRMRKASPALFDLYLPVALAAVSSQLGTSHRTYGELVWQRGLRSEALNHLDEAIGDYQTALKIYAATAGAEHRSTLELRFCLARANELAGRTSVAKQHFETCYRGLFRIWGPTHWTTGRVGRDLAALLTGLGQFDEAEPYLLEPFVACQKELGLNHELTQRMAEGLVGLYEAWDRPTEATRYRSMLVVPNQSAAPTGRGAIESGGFQYDDAMLSDLGPAAKEPTDVPAPSSD